MHPEIAAGTRAAVLALGDTAYMDFVVSRLTILCLRSHGFHVPLGPSLPPDPSTTHLSGVMGLLDLDTASVRGYGALIVTGEPGAEPLQEFAELLPATKRQQFDEFLDGTGPDETVRVGGYVLSASSDGCVADSRRTVYGSVTNFLRLAYLPYEITGIGAEIVQSRAYVDAVKEYSRCMQRSGVHVESPKEALALARDRFGDKDIHQTPTADEIAFAVVDARCQAEANLRSVLDDELISRSAHYIAHHEAELLDLSELLRQSRARAQAALEDAGGA